MYWRYNGYFELDGVLYASLNAEPVAVINRSSYIVWLIVTVVTTPSIEY